jgi:membrane-bound ClpP family serine protease
MMSVLIFYSYYERNTTPGPLLLLLIGAVFALAEWVRPSAGVVGHVVLFAFAFHVF